MTNKSRTAFVAGITLASLLTASPAYAHRVTKGDDGRVSSVVCEDLHRSDINYDGTSPSVIQTVDYGNKRIESLEIKKDGTLVYTVQPFASDKDKMPEASKYVCETDTCTPTDKKNKSFSVGYPKSNHDELGFWSFDALRYVVNAIPDEKQKADLKKKFGKFIYSHPK